MDEEAYQIFSKHGYYSKYLNLDTDKAVKVLSLNTDSCDNLNHFTWSSLADPNGQYEWLKSQLEDLESKGHLAIMVSHIPPDECTHQWAVRFQALLDRY